MGSACRSVAVYAQNATKRGAVKSVLHRAGCVHGEKKQAQSKPRPGRGRRDWGVSHWATCARSFELPPGSHREPTVGNSARFFAQELTRAAHAHSAPAGPLFSSKSQPRSCTSGHGADYTLPRLRGPQVGKTAERAECRSQATR